jgi:hypothetical protein
MAAAAWAPGRAGSWGGSLLRRHSQPELCEAYILGSSNADMHM